MFYFGYDIEDVLIFNCVSVDWGFGWCYVFKKVMMLMWIFYNGLYECIVYFDFFFWFDVYIFVDKVDGMIVFGVIIN